MVQGYVELVCGEGESKLAGGLSTTQHLPLRNDPSDASQRGQQTLLL